MGKMYFDNACVSYPKAGGISDMLREYADLFDSELEAEDRMFINNRRALSAEAKNGVKKLLNCNSSTEVFLASGTVACIQAICKVLYRPKMHCICAYDDCNPIISTLKSLKCFDVDFTNIEYNKNGLLDLNRLENSIDCNTAFVLIPYASHAIGTLQEIDKISEICKKYGTPLIIDISLAVGQIPVRFDDVKADALLFTADKTLLGLDGVSAIVVNKSIADKLSADNAMLESDVAALSLHALNKSLMFIENIGIEEMYEKTEQLVVCFLYGIKHMRGIELLGSWNSAGRIGVIAINFENKDNALCAERLYSEYGIVSYNDISSGAVRFSVSYFNTLDEVNDVLNAIQTVSDE